jgi:RNA polymerase sigma-70 factor, ECF subfamily
VLYAELHRTARAYMRRERIDHTLQATALLNEAFLRMVQVDEVSWEDRTHFFKLASQMMRRILVDHARSRQNLKRGGGARRISLEESAFISPNSSLGLVALDMLCKRSKR